MNDDPLDLEPARATAAARAIVAGPATAAVLAALGDVLAAGGEVVLRMGNHDVELALPEVQEVLRGALGQPVEVASRLRFEEGHEPGLLEVGGARLLVTHGEQRDPWNKVDYASLAEGAGRFLFAPGSHLVKAFLNPLTKDYGLRFANLLKPDFQGATLAALAVAPDAARLLFQKASLDIGWQLLKKALAPPTFEIPAVDPRLAERVDAAGLTGEERAALEALWHPGAVSFSAGDESPAATRARTKLVRAGLSMYAEAQRLIAGTSSERFFELAPSQGEWDEARRLAGKYGVEAVILGHTHAARWRAEEGLVLANTGTWIWLMALPHFDAGEEAWTQFLVELRQNPGLDPAQQLAARTIRRLTAVQVAEREGGGALIALLEWGEDGVPVTRGAADVLPAHEA
jgi:predicted phosphodiesterase